MAASKSARCEAERIIRTCEAQGFRTRTTKKGVLVLGEDGSTSVMVHMSLSEYRGWKNMIAALRRMGVTL